MSNDKYIRDLAARLKNDSAFLGYWIDKYQSTLSKSDEAFAGELNIGEGALNRLRICQKPREQSFKHDVELICTAVGISKPASLANVLRQAILFSNESHNIIATPQTQLNQLLAAAQRKEKEPEDNE